MSFPFRTALSLAAVSGTCLTAAACGGGGGGGDPLASMTAQQVLNKAVANLKSASTVSLSGTESIQGGATTVRLDYKHGAGCQGTVSQGAKGSFALVVIGNTAWVKPDAAFWKANAGKQAQQAMAAVGGRYLKGSTSNGNVSQLSDICDVNTLASSLSKPTTVTKEAITTVNGQSTLPLKDETKGGVLYVTDTSNPQILQVVNTKPGTTGKISFAYGNQVSLTAPPASETVNGASFGF